MSVQLDCPAFDSIIEYGHHEACLHKYHCSGNARRDLGARAYGEWFREYWVAFCHHRWVQYLYAERAFPEFCQPKYHGRIRVDADGRVWARDVELCPVAVGFVQRMFLREHRPWEMLTFANNRKEIEQLGFNYEDVRKVLVEFGINECRLNWREFFAVEECQVKNEYRRFMRHREASSYV